jgi:phospholipid/cholesterol/gamma-HCH transport system permease protein
VVPGLVQALARDAVPLVLGVFAAGRVSVELAARLGGMGLSREIDALTGLGHDPARYALSPALAAVVIAAPIHALAATVSALFAAGMALRIDAVTPWGRYLQLTLTDDTFQAALLGMGKALVFLLIAATVGAAVGSRETRNASDLAEGTTVAFTVGLLAVFTAAALWTALG